LIKEQSAKNLLLKESEFFKLLILKDVKNYQDALHRQEGRFAVKKLFLDTLIKKGGRR
jgi:hypothetical protein